MKKVLVIGLDGATWKVALPLVKAGKMPNLQKLMEGGAWGVLKSTRVIHSGPAWATAVTGVDMGKHGVYDFVKRDPGSYNNRVLRTGDFRTQAVWDTLSSKGLKVGFINLPVMYPPAKVNGFTISGTTTPRAESQFAYPKSLANEIRRKFRGYRVEPSASISMNNPKKFVDETMRGDDKIFEVARHLMRTREWNLFWVVFVGPDRLQHRFWKYQDPNHPGYVKENEFESVISDYYRKADGYIGKLVEEAGERTDVIVMSDHGFGPVWGQLNVSTWLEKAGFLKRKKSSRLIQDLLSKTGAFWVLRQIYLGLMKKGLVDERYIPKVLLKFVPSEAPVHDLAANVDWEKTSAFPDGFGRIIINDGRFPKGIVKETEKLEVSNQVISGLLSLRNENGQRVVKKVARREEIARGPALRELPDLFVFPCRGYMNGGFGSSAIGKSKRLGFEHNGDHDQNGIIATAGPDVQAGKRCRNAMIRDITPTVLFLLGIAPDRNADGRVLREALTRKAAGKRAVTVKASKKKKPGKARANNADEEIVKERLRGLGYLD